MLLLSTQSRQRPADRLKNGSKMGGVQFFHIKLELGKYYKDSEMTAFISERSRNSK